MTRTIDMDMLKTGRAATYLPLLVLAAVSLAIFWPALGHDFLVNWDDRDYVLANPVVQGLTPEHVKAAFSSFFMGNYAPLHIISYMLDYEIWGLRASGFIFTNILLHTANGLLFFLLLRKLNGEKVWVLFAALLFLLHPVQVESVVWVSQRKNLLAMLFFLSAFYWYASYRDGEQGPRKILYLASLAAFTLALLSKSVAVILPPVLVLFDLCYRDRRGLKSLLIDKVPFVAVALLVALLALKSHSAEIQGGATGYHGGSPYATFLTMLPVLVSYLRMVVWPVNLSAYYDPPIRDTIDLPVAGAGLFLVLLILFGVALYRRRRERFFWYALFFIGLVPVSQIVPIVTLINDRYLYFPLLGGAAFLGMTLLGDSDWAGLRASRRGLAASAVALAVLAACALLTVQRSAVWQNSYTLWADVVSKAPQVAMPRFALGEAQMEMGKIDEAIATYEAALRPGMPFGRAEGSVGIAVSTAGAHCNLGTAYARKGMTDQAIRHFTIAVNLAPDMANAHFNLGNALAGSGRLEEALSSFETADRLSPGNPAFQANLRMTRELLAARRGGAAPREGGDVPASPAESPRP